MRLTGNIVRAALTGAAAVALLTACSGGSSSSSATSTSAVTSSSAATTTAAGPTGADAAFCAAVPQLTAELAGAQAAPPQQAVAQLQQLVANFSKVTPPAALQSDWQALGTGLNQVVTAAGQLDLGTAQGQAQFQQLAQKATAAAAPAQGNISAWVVSNCGGGSGSSAAGSSSASSTS